MADYCTVAEIKADNPESGFNSSIDYDTALGGFITDASRAIDRDLGRWDNFFYPSSDAGTYFYDGSGTNAQLLDEFVSITSVSVSEQGYMASSDYTLWSSSDYLTIPYNSTPIYKLLIDRNGAETIFARYPKNVKVIGIRGYSTTPPAIVKRACKIQTMRWFIKAKNSWREQGGQSDPGMVNITYQNQNRIDISMLDADVSKLLNNIRLGLEGAE